MADNFDSAYLRELAYKWKKGQLNDAERQYLADWEASQLDDLLVLPDSSVKPEAIRERMYNNLMQQIAATEVFNMKTVRLWPKIAGIAAAVATIVFGVWFYRYQVASQARNDGPIWNDGIIANDVAPGKYGATITLANGQVIQLDSAKKGVVVGGAAGAAGLRYDDGSALSSLQGGTTKQSPLQGEIASETTQPRNDGKEHSNVMMMVATTAKGQTYSFTLPDGSKVWLNADSKLEFPAQFSGKERKILMQGEAYFVVKHNSKQPFRVVSKTPDGKAQLVEDIGTEFNINAYADERSVKTTLVEGAASVSSLLGKDIVTLTPNQQANLANGKITVNKVDVKQAIDWKNNEFVFNKAPLDDVMRKVARWYNVEIIYAKDFKSDSFTGSVSRFDHISAVLKILELTGTVHFRIEGRKVIVTN